MGSKKTQDLTDLLRQFGAHFFQSVGGEVQARLPGAENRSFFDATVWAWLEPLLLELSEARAAKAVSGEAHVDGATLLHRDCLKAHREAALGRPHRCPACRGTGWAKAPTTSHEVESYDPSGGYNGWHSPLSQRVVSRDVPGKACEPCSGHGYTAEPLEPVVERTERVVGYRRKS